MIKILFFAQLREQLDCSELNFDIDSSVPLKWLLEQLCAQGERWQEHLKSGSVLMAVNQTLVDENSRVHPGDEVAFFPPVTGG